MVGRLRGWVQTAESNKKRSESLKGVSRPRISAALMGHPGWNKGKPNPGVSLALHGRTQPIELVEKRRQGLLKSFRLGRQSWNKGLTKNDDSRVASTSKKLTGLKRPPEFCEKQRARYLNGLYWGKGWQLVTSQKGGTFKCRSMLEVHFALALDVDPAVVSFEYETVRVPYWFEGQQKCVLVDFLVHCVACDQLVEVKPRYALRYERNLAKLKAMGAYAEHVGFNFFLWDEGYYNLEGGG